MTPTLRAGLSAGSITALMTEAHALPDQRPHRPGHRAVRRLPKNREPMLRVMGKHRAAVDEIDAQLVQTDLLEAARTAWDEAIALGTEHGYRKPRPACSPRPGPSGC